MKKILPLFLLLPLWSFVSFTNDDDVFFGDSITFGNELGSQQYTARWSTQYCHAIPTDELNEAFSGEAMTPGLNAGRPVFNINDVPAYQSTYRHIFVSYWVNDFLYGGTPAAFAAATTNAVNGIIAKGWPAAKIVLCFNYLPAATISNATALQWLNALRSVRQAKGTSFLDFYTPIYNRPDNASYATDGIHPTVAWNGIMKQYALTNIEAPSSLLPVTFVSFSGQRQGTASLLKWTVAQEQSIARYEAERSQAGTNWIKVGEVISPGNTTDQRSYSCSDNNAGADKQFYRLKVIGTDGSIRFSNIIIMNALKAAGFSLGVLFPNPASSRLNMLLSVPAKETVSISLVDAAGRIIMSRQAAVEAGSNTLDFNVSDVRAGVYLVKVTSGTNDATAVERFTKQ